jgi:predicted RNase H-like nuclease (RuvC/YqgF family)
VSVKKLKYQFSQKRYLQIILPACLILFFLSFCNSLWAQSIRTQPPSVSGSEGSKVEALNQQISSYISTLNSEKDVLKNLQAALKELQAEKPTNSSKAAQKKYQQKVQDLNNKIKKSEQKIKQLQTKIKKAQRNLKSQKKGLTLNTRKDTSAQRTPVSGGSKSRR